MLRRGVSIMRPFHAVRRGRVFGACTGVALWLLTGFVGTRSATPKFEPVVATPVGRRAFDDLRAYYRACDARKSGTDKVHLATMLAQLADSDPQKRKEAGAYLYALCVQTEADDRSGRTPRPRGMSLGGGPSYYGAQLRGQVARRVSRAKLHGDGAEAFDAAEWLYRNDVWPAHREDAVEALTRIRTPDADAVFVEITEKAEGHFDILTMALEQARERSLVGAVNHVRNLCRHYNADVREAARAAARGFGLEPIPSYDPSTDLGPRLEQWLKTSLAILPDKVPAGATWCRFTVPAVWFTLVSTKDPKEFEVCGWLLGEEAEVYRVIDWMGQPGRWPREKVEIHPDSLEAFAARIIKIRGKYNASEDCSEKSALQKRVGIRSFMMSSGATWNGSIPEVLAAAWSLERGDRGTAVRLMVPLMEDVSDEQAFLDYLRDEIAVKLDRRMLAAFTGRRDYAEALRIAKILASPWFDGFRHQARAKGLAATLPDRTEDFKTLRLMAPQEWEAFKKTAGRRQQIEHLAERLRLICASQGDIPGGISYSDPQYLWEAGNGDENGQIGPFAFSVFGGKKAINPYSELLRLNMTGAEMQQLVPYLESEHYILAYDLYRFIPNNPFSLHRVSWVVASIFNSVSRTKLVDRSKLASASRGADAQQIPEVRAWCNENADLTHADHLARAVLHASKWQDTRWAFWGLLDLEEDRAVELIVARCDQEPIRESELSQLLCLLDRQEYLPRARRWMRSRDRDMRFWGALLVLKHADRNKPEGLKTVLRRLAAEIRGSAARGDTDLFVGDSGDFFDAAVEALVRVDGRQVRKFFRAYCGKRVYPGFDPSLAALQRLFLAGHEPVLDRLLRILDDRSPAYEGSERPLCDSWLWRLSLWRYEQPPDDLYDPPEDRSEQACSDLKRWLRAQFKLIKDGKPSDIIKQELPVPWGNWRSYSSGWVRRL